VARARKSKQHEDCAPFLDLSKDKDLRSDRAADAARRQPRLLDIVRDVHCRKGPAFVMPAATMSTAAATSRASPKSSSATYGDWVAQNKSLTPS
jgi:hypothetical protein